MIKIIRPLLCYYPSQAGGPANSLYWLNCALNPDGFSSVVVATKYGLVSDSDSQTFSANHNVSFFNSKGKSFIKKSIQELKTADIVQFSSLFFPPTLPILFAAIRNNKTIIISPRGELYQAAISQKAFQKKVWISIIKMFQNKIHFHATNTFELEIIKKTFPKAKSTVVIPNYMEMPKKLNLDVTMSFVFVGRINPIKNIDLLISAIAEVIKTHPKVSLVIVGSARLDYEIAYHATLKAQIKQLALEDVVVFKGHLNGEIKNKVIASSKALLLPSKSENFGNVVLEALAQGTPVMASKNTPWAILEEKKAGFWEDSTVENLTKNMLKILDLNKLDYQHMRDNAYNLCKSNFDIKTNINVWEKYYQKITNYV